MPLPVACRCELQPVTASRQICPSILRFRPVARNRLPKGVFEYVVRRRRSLASILRLHFLVNVAHGCQKAKSASFWQRWDCFRLMPNRGSVKVL